MARSFRTWKTMAGVLILIAFCTASAPAASRAAEPQGSTPSVRRLPAGKLSTSKPSFKRSFSMPSYYKPTNKPLVKPQAKSAKIVLANYRRVHQRPRPIV